MYQQNCAPGGQMQGAGGFAGGGGGFGAGAQGGHAGGVGVGAGGVGGRYSTGVGGGGAMVGGGGTVVDGGGAGRVGVVTDTGCTTGCMAGGASCGEGCVVATGNGVMTFVGPGQGQYVTETTFRYVGSGGNISMVQPRYILWGRVCCMSLIPLALLMLMAFLLMRPTDSTSKQESGFETTSSLQEQIEPPVSQPPTAQPPTAQPTPPPTEGECTFWGDPHVKTFDGARPSFYGNGEQWIVHSKTVSIQGRYMGTKYTKGLAATNKIAVGGPFLKGHIIIIPTLEEGPITIDHMPKLESFGTETIDDLATITYSSQGELVDEATSIWEKHIVHMDLPLGVELTVLRWNNYLDLRLAMPQQPDQDGACGNFNGDASDDTTAAIYERVGARVDHGMLLFNHRVREELTSEEDKLIDLCPRDKYEEALRVCPDDLQNFRTNPDDTMTRECALDICYGANEHTLRTAKALGI